MIQAESVGRVAQSIAAIATEIDDETSVALIQELIEQLPRAELNVIVAGQFKRGKSSLINALLGDDVMPTGSLPLTGIATAIRYGNAPRIEVRVRHEPEPKVISVDELSLYVTERFNPANAVGVQRVDVAWPAERIRGFAVFDTPGVGSTYEHNTATAIAALPRADIAVLVAGPEPPIGSEEIAYAQQVVASSERLFVVLNKADLAGDALPEILAFTRSMLEPVAPGIEIIALSATRARDAQHAGTEDPQFALFVHQLREFLDTRGSEVLVHSIARRARAIVERLTALVAMREATLRLPSIERERRRAALEKALQSIDDRVRSLEIMVGDDIARLSLRVEDVLERLEQREKGELAAYVNELIKERSENVRFERIERMLQERAAAWRAQAIEVADNVLRSYAEKYERLLGEIERSILEAGCEALHVELAESATATVSFSPSTWSVIGGIVPTTGLEVAIALFTALLPPPLRERMLRARYTQTLEAAFGALRGKLRYSITRDLDPWRRSTQHTIVSSIQTARRLVLRAFDEPSEGDASSSALESCLALAQRLNAVQHELSLSALQS